MALGEITELYQCTHVSVLVLLAGLNQFCSEASIKPVSQVEVCIINAHQHSRILCSDNESKTEIVQAAVFVSCTLVVIEIFSSGELTLLYKVTVSLVGFSIL